MRAHKLSQSVISIWKKGKLESLMCSCINQMIKTAGYVNKFSRKAKRGKLLDINPFTLHV